MRPSWLVRVLCALFVIGLLTPAFAGKGKGQNDDIEKVNDHERIDWTTGMLTATGLGAISNEEPNEAKAYLRARGFAKLDALRNMLMLIGHVHIDSQTTGADYEATNDTIRAEVSGIVRGAQVVAERRIKVGRDSMVEVTVATHMYGDQGIARAFVPEEVLRAKERVREVAPDSGNTIPIPPEVAPVRPRVEVPEIPAAPETGQPYTSVIIDTRGFSINRSMSPKILRRDGSEVWGTVQVDPDYVIEHGIVVYAHSMEDARRLSRAGRHPLEIRAVRRGHGPFPSDAVIDDGDADRLMSLNSRDGFLDKFNVIFVVDPLK